MSKVYPRAPEAKKDLTPVDEATCVAAIIQAKEDGLSKAEAVGGCLNGSDDVKGFERLWKDVEQQAAKARSVNPADYNTVSAFKAAVSDVAPRLDATKWYDGLKAEKEVTSFGELTAKVEELAEPVKE